MVRPGYVQLWGVLHRSLSMLAGGSAMQLNPNRVSGSPTRSAPPPPAGEELRELEIRWERCRTDRDRRFVLKDAYKLLKQHTLPVPDPRALRGTSDWRQAIALDPRSSREVAVMFGVSKTTVLRYRKEFHD